MTSISRIALLVFLPLVLVACGGESSTPPGGTNPDNPDNSTPDVPIIEEPEPTPDPEPTPTPDPEPTPTPDPEPTPTPDPEPTPDPGPGPTPDPGPEPVFQGAMYSYTNNIATAVPLQGAVLEQQTVYIFWQGADVSNVNYYCCKGLSGDATGESHNPRISSSNYPFAMQIDASQLSTSGSRELYVDYRTSDGVLHYNNYTTFSVNVTGSPEPTPVEKDVTLSWSIPDSREDGSDLEVYEIDGYIIYIAEGNTPIEQGSPVDIDDAQTTEYTFEALQQGNYKVAISTYDSEGMSSERSETMTFSVQ